MIADDVWPGDEVRTDHGEGDLSHREQTTDADLEKLAAVAIALVAWVIEGVVGWPVDAIVIATIVLR